MKSSSEQCKFKDCQYNFFPPRILSQECIGCRGNKYSDKKYSLLRDKLMKKVNKKYTNLRIKDSKTYNELQKNIEKWGKKICLE